MNTFKLTHAPPRSVTSAMRAHRIATIVGGVLHVNFIGNSIGTAHGAGVT